MNSLSNTLASQQTVIESTGSDYCQAEEKANALSHALGIVAGIIGLMLMLIKAPDHLTFVQITGVVIYGISIIALFLASTLYHSSKSALWRKRYKMADHQ